MLRLPSIQKEYDDYWSGDPAFVQPPKEPGKEASDEARAKWKEAVAEHLAKIKRARETGDWSSLLIEGEQPTKFIMKPLKGQQLRFLIDEHMRADQFRIGDAQLSSLVFRCAFSAVKNLGVAYNDKPVRHPDLGLIASSDVTDMLDQIDQSIVAELASVAFEKAQNLNPL